MAPIQSIPRESMVARPSTVRVEQRMKVPTSVPVQERILYRIVEVQDGAKRVRTLPRGSCDGADILAGSTTAQQQHCSVWKEDRRRIVYVEIAIGVRDGRVESRPRAIQGRSVHQMRRCVCATNLLVRPRAAVGVAIRAFLALWVLVRGSTANVIKDPSAIRGSAHRRVVCESIHNHFLPLERTQWCVGNGMHNNGIRAPGIQATTVGHLCSKHVILLIITQCHRTTPTCRAVENGRWRVCRRNRRGHNVQERAVVTKPWSIAGADTLLTNSIQVAIIVHRAIGQYGPHRER